MDHNSESLSGQGSLHVCKFLIFIFLGATNRRGGVAGQLGDVVLYQLEELRDVLIWACCHEGLQEPAIIARVIDCLWEGLQPQLLVLDDLEGALNLSLAVV